MSQYFFNITKNKPTKKEANRWNRISRKYGGAYVEINRKQNSCISINNGNYQGWFAIPNRGNPFDQNTQNDILNEINS